ncbi:Phosphatidylglycerophosphatase A [Alteracholeplasma palmae J233]|uniref:Phosphatidylglycerophosphatase A n=1 Tax=Alteracholeplasma palmae (strain ATCC 49389 / J233) TaxID=1318466 RepID=U4KP92_ALTPJ|nr:phosphatidylglycerophosphatase A [Alteracholeplasma palmae]CCV64035.1 Phosphatidylglycerophosphatase A [Alteracholeplasma palmae J233]
MNNTKKKLLYTQEEMLRINKETLARRGVKVSEIAEIAYRQQSKYTEGVSLELCVQSVERILSFRDIFHHVQLASEIDRLAEEKLFKGPIQDILYEDLGLFGIDELMGIDVAGNYGTIGVTNFGEIDVNKQGIVSFLNEEGKKEGKCHTFLDDIVGSIAAAASTRVAQIMSEETAHESDAYEKTTIYDYIEK